MKVDFSTFLNSYLEKAVSALTFPHNYRGAGYIAFDYDYNNFVNTGVLPNSVNDEIAQYTLKIENYMKGLKEEEKLDAIKKAYFTLLEYLKEHNQEATDDDKYAIHKVIFYIIDKQNRSIKGIITHEQLDYNFDKVENYYLSAKQDDIKLI